MRQLATSTERKAPEYYGHMNCGIVIDQTSDEIEKPLRGSMFNFAVDKLLSYSLACGSYPVRLEKRTNKIQPRKVRVQAHWEIKHPQH